MNTLWQVVYLALYLFYLALMARLVVGFVVRFARRWEPNRPTAIALELVFSVSDPPLKGLRRIIPPLRLGTVALDLAFLILLIGVFVVRVFLVERLVMAT